MGVAIDVEQPRGVDLGVDLGRRQAGMAEQFLERAKIRAPRQQMRREAVAQRMRRQAVGQAEPRAARRRTARRTRSALSGPPLAPTNSGASPASGHGHGAT